MNCARKVIIASCYALIDEQWLINFAFFMVTKPPSKGTFPSNTLGTRLMVTIFNSQDPLIQLTLLGEEDREDMRVRPENYVL